MNEIFDEEKDSLVTFYILPLLKINFRTFGYHFKTSLLFRTKDAIQVELFPGCKEKYWEHENYQSDYIRDGVVYVIFSIPSEFKEDVEIFCKGNYSQMSQKTKKIIYEYSGLYHNKQIDNLVVTDTRLLALTKSPVLKEWILKTYRLKYGENVELIRLNDKDSIYTKN